MQTTPVPALDELTSSQQNYLKAIWALQEWNPERVSKSALGARVKVSLASVSDAMRKLADMGLVDDNRYGTVDLTEVGRQRALEIVRRHRLIESFLVKSLGYTWDQVHADAEKLEHAVSSFFVERIDAYLDHPSRDPHGDPIPTPEGTIVYPATVRLSDIKYNARVRVVRIADDDSQLLRFFSDNEIGLDSVLVVTLGNPFNEAFSFTVEDSGVTVQLGRSAARDVRVELLQDG